MSSIHAEDAISDDSVDDSEIPDVGNASDAGDAEDSPMNTYSDLFNQINGTEEGSILNLTADYIFDSASDESFVMGIPISKNITIKGSNGMVCIDGKGTARGFCIDSNCHIVLENIIFKNCYCEGNGAGIYIKPNSTLELTECGFDNNKAFGYNGGAIYGECGTIIEVQNSSFSKNQAIRNYSFTWDEFKSGMGSAIAIQIDSILRIYGSVFFGNTAGLATILVNSLNDSNKENKVSTLYIDNCSFENNTSATSGVIYLDELGQGEILNSVFTNNHATFYGGPLVLDTCYSALVKNCLFEDNSGVSGGAIYIGVFSTLYRSNVNIVDCNFTNNTASKDGGAIHSRWGVVEVSGCNFYNNTSPDKGGAISAARGTIKISNSNFANNTSPNGGALYLETSDSTVVKSAFDSNSASVYGGAVYSARDCIKISESSFHDNSANCGGALFLESKKNYVLNSIFDGNRASRYGGAVFSRNGPIRVSASQFNNNSAISGGALFLQNEKIYALNSKFTGNTATKYGGAVYSKVRSVSSSGCSYSENSAPKGKDVYGVYKIDVKQYNSRSGPVKLKITLTSPWKMSNLQQIKLEFKGTHPYKTKWLKTSSKGVLILKVARNVKLAKSKLKVTMKSGDMNYIGSWNKVDTSRIYYQKEVKKPKAMRITVKTYAYKKIIKNTKFQVKIYTGKTFSVHNVKTNSKGIFYLSTKKLTKGSHKIVVTLNNRKYEINKRLTVNVI